MKRIWVYLLGVLTGIVVSVIALIIIAIAINAGNDPATRMSSGMTFFERSGDVIKESSFKVFQALGDGTALAEGKGDSHSSIYTGINVLLYNEKGTPYYDEQIVTVPHGKCFRQVGIYRYSARSGSVKTVPIIMIMEK